VAFVLFPELKSIQLSQQCNAGFDPQCAAVEADMVMLRNAPFRVRIEPVIGTAPLILIAQTFFRCNITFTVELDDAFRAMLHVGMDEHTQAVRFFAENVVRTASDNDAGTLLCKVENDLPLNFPQVVLIGRVAAASCGECVHKPVGMRRIFALFCDIILIKAAFLCKFFDEFVVIAGDTELFAQKSADGSAAASELAADGDNSVRHSILPFCCKVAACVRFYEYHSILSWKSQAIFVSFDVFYTNFR